MTSPPAKKLYKPGPGPLMALVTAQPAFPREEKASAHMSLALETVFPGSKNRPRRAAVGAYCRDRVTRLFPWLAERTERDCGWLGRETVRVFRRRMLLP